MPHFQAPESVQSKLPRGQYLGRECYIWGVFDHLVRQYAILTYVDGGDAEEDFCAIAEYEEEGGSPTLIPLDDDPDYKAEVRETALTVLIIKFDIQPDMPVRLHDGTVVQCALIDAFEHEDLLVYIFADLEEHRAKGDDADWFLVLEKDNELQEVSDEATADKLWDAYDAIPEPNTSSDDELDA